MIKYKYIILFLLLPAVLIAQSGNQSIVEGSITFISSQNVYVKFDNTDGISVGDTLLMKSGEIFTPVVKVQHISSKSVAGPSLTELKMGIGDKIVCLNPSGSGNTAGLEEILPLRSEVVLPMQAATPYRPISRNRPRSEELRPPAGRRQ